VIQQSREEKIVRLEALMAGVLPRETFLGEEWAALLHEHKVKDISFHIEAFSWTVTVY